jgi:transcriptional regulator with GAF, ATPase, and Fis domain
MNVDSEVVAAFANRVLRTIDGSDDVHAFLDSLLPAMTESVPGASVLIARPDQGRWYEVYRFGGDVAFPRELLSEALDRNGAVSELSWLIRPIVTQATTTSFLAVQLPIGAQQEQIHQWELLAEMIGNGLGVLRVQTRMARRIRRLEAIQSIVSGWKQTSDLNSLLHEMAKTSTELLAAERASIFLWDRPGKRLIGRPALGVENHELIIPDDTGIVGEVVQSGRSRRINHEGDTSDIDRSVDEKLRFQTRSLLCVPLRQRDGKILGVFEMINKRDGNFSTEDEVALVELAGYASRALEDSKEYTRLLESRRQIAEEAAQRVQLIGKGQATQQLRESIHRVAPTDLAVLLLGENGTGKEVASQLIHYLSPRRDEPFVAVNCAAITETLLESELFGHEQGAFTDAIEARAGKFELASGGTLFLDEIGDLSLGGQSKLLRVLEDKTVIRVGGKTPIETNARVIAATNQDLAALVREKAFREDLFYRLNIVTLEISPLRDRTEDILPMANYFLASFSAKAGRSTLSLSKSAQARLLRHPWPGNVRELKNLMERLAYLAPSDVIDEENLALLQPDAEGIRLDQTLPDATRQFQINYIQQQITSAGGHMTIAARRLGLHRANLYRKMNQLGMIEESSQES